MGNDAQSYYKITFGLKVATFAVLRIKYSQNNYVSVPYNHPLICFKEV